MIKVVQDFFPQQYHHLQQKYVISIIADTTSFSICPRFHPKFHFDRKHICSWDTEIMDISFESVASKRFGWIAMSVAHKSMGSKMIPMYR